MSSVKAAESAFTLFCTPYPKLKRQAPAVFGKATPLQFNMQGYTIKGFRWNEGGSKRILILHGFASSAYNFHQYVIALINKGYEVLAFDAPAHGLSSGKTVNALQYSSMIDQVNQLYGPVHGYLAHSFGGIALSLALERIPHDSTTKVVFVAPATETSTAIDQAFIILRLQKAKVRSEFDKIIHRLSGQTVDWFSIRRAMQQVQASVLWIHDEDDTITPLSDALKVQADNHPNIAFVITKGLGHQQIYRDATVRECIVSYL